MDDAENNMDERVAELALATAIRAARAGGEIISAYADKISSLNIEQKTLNDFVSEVDRNSEQAVKKIVQSQFLGHSIVGEEYGSTGAVESDFIWYIDPLDGTTNFLRSIPHYAVSIGLCYRGKPSVAVVFDPAKDELYTAMLDKGAQLNGQAISVSRLAGLDGALLATGVPFSGAYLERLDSFSDTMNGLLKQNTSGIRRLGSAALDLAYVAAGRYDGYWEAGLRPWDICAGLLLVHEAGGVTSDLAGLDDSLSSGDVLAANPAIHAAMLTTTSLHY